MKLSLNNTFITRIVDAMIGLLSFVVAYLLRFNFNIPTEEITFFLLAIPIYLTIRWLVSYYLSLHKITNRYVSISDAKLILTSVVAGTLILIGINLFSKIGYRFHFIPFSIVLIDVVFCSFLLLGYRVAFRWRYEDNRKGKINSKKVMIFGAGEAGVLTKNSLQRAAESYDIVAFIDDDLKLSSKKIDSIPVYSSSLLTEKIIELQPEMMIIAVLQLGVKRKNELADSCREHKIQLLNLPHTSKWMDGVLDVNKLEKLKFEDLLPRDAIQLDTDKIKSYITAKSVVITGAAGSIGSELARQIIKFNPSKLILVDVAESPLFLIDNELQNTTSIHVVPCLLDIRNSDELEQIFINYEPEIILHAAAYKHVPLMEQFPHQAIGTNTIATFTLAQLASKYQIEKMVFVSTDKAVNPTNVMGASKRLAERLILFSHQQKNNATAFITTRFGNVLGSNGSVIPTFKKQIENGGPVTVTHPDVTRYFMTIPEACQLVLEACTIGKGGELMLFDMGELIKIDTLAKRMIQLSGKQLDSDIKIVYTGLRPGEKLFEELLTNDEDCLPTHHPKIMIGKHNHEVKANEIAAIQQFLGEYKALTNLEIKQKLKTLVPEYTPEFL